MVVERDRMRSCCRDVDAYDHVALAIIRECEVERTPKVAALNMWDGNET